MRALSLVLIALAVAACDTAPIVPGEPLTRQQVEAARSEFAASGIDTYRIRYEIQCFCPPNTVEVEVAEGRVVATNSTSYEVDPLTVLDLYDLVLDAYREDAALVRATVSSERPRVPADIYIDRDERMADEEVGYRILSFEAR